MNYVAISDCLKHDTIAVHLFQEGLIKYLKAKLKDLNTIYYFSDGAAAQYKNKKNFTNLVFHYDDFAVKAEWHFFATSHGKGPCDGLGGTVKRLAARASLQSINSPINNATKFYTWVKNNINHINTEFFCISQYEERANHLKKRFNKAKMIMGTVGYHAFIPHLNKKIKVQKTSSAEEFEVRTVYKA